MQAQLKSLFKPYEIHKKHFSDFLDAKTKRNYIKHKLWFECSKSLDESCINTECHYNYLNMHEDELYIKVMQEIQAERKEVEERTKRQMQKHYGTSFGD